MKVFKQLDNNALLSSQTIVKAIAEDRTYLMGIAMLMVLIFHAFCWIYNPFGVLNIGYAGVDIFLFLSGYGLAHSYQKNSLSTFYKNRIKRIYPLYFICVCIAYLIYHSHWTLSDFLLNLITLGYYIHYGEMRFDWYTESLFTLYLLFPLFYAYSKSGYKGLFFLFSCIFALLCYFNILWHYDCLIARIPIFVYGAMFVRYNKHTLAFAITGIILFIPCIYFSSKFLATSLLVLPIIYISIYCLKYLNATTKSLIEFCGKYSLEIYLANVLMHKILGLYAESTISRLLIYITLQIVFSFCLISINNWIKRVLK